MTIFLLGPEIHNFQVQFHPFLHNYNDIFNRIRIIITHISSVQV